MLQSTNLEALVADIRHQAGKRDAHVGVSLIHLESGEQADFNGDDLFPLASTYKIPMAAAALSYVDRGELTLGQMFDIPDEARVVSSVITENMPHPGISLSLHNIMDLMMRESDNTATDVLLRIINGPEGVTAWLRQAGIEGLRVDRSTAQLLRQFAGLPEPGDQISFVDQAAALDGDPRLQTYFTDGSGEAYRKFVKDPQDQGTPNAMSRLLAGLWRGQLLSPESTRALQEIMLRCETGNARLKGRLPDSTPVAHKSGTVAGTVNDVGVITLPGESGHLVISVYVKNAVGERDEYERLIADISRTAYDYFVAENSSQR
ncbi:MAG: class A beta-lactamase [Xanthomonadales bacterium]|nr:class A beta-lactamase [Xanthomonadales bacterium]